MLSRRKADSRLVAVFFVAAIIFGAAATVSAQASSPNPVPPNPPSSTKASKRAPGGFFVTLSRRSLFFPDIAATPGPLSPTGKFKLFVSDSISFSVLAESALSASIAQATDSPEGYGQGGEAYAKRFGSSMARRASSEFFGTFLLASMLREDPRFFPEENPTLAGSMKYSVQRLFITRNDDGQDVANWSGLLGPLMAEGLANSYWPEQNRSTGETFERYGVDLASRVGTNILRNYWPVFFKKLRGSRRSGGRP
jgi:hypothetical protein